MRRPILALLTAILGFIPAAPALALSGATPDGEDRFPYVVEIRFDDSLICSGTVLFPRIVVTAAHCLSHRVRPPGGPLYVDEYAQASELTVVAMRHGKPTTHEVADVTVSPGWRSAIVGRGQRANSRFVHDIALIVTREPIEVTLPPSLFKLALGEAPSPEDVNCARETAASDPSETTPDAALREALLQRLSQHGVLVAFGAESCTPRFCGASGVRRYRSIAIQESASCFKDRAGNFRHPAPSPELADMLPLAVWCMESSVLPGDSGGALMVEGPHGELYFLGVISAQQGWSLALADALLEKRSLAAALYPSLDFILAEARKLGYAR
jgi:hypothetical protein